jgi:hypothetical protein
VCMHFSLQVRQSCMTCMQTHLWEANWLARIAAGPGTRLRQLPHGKELASGKGVEHRRGAVGAASLDGASIKR